MKEKTPIEQLIEYCKRSVEFVSGPDDSKEDRFAGMAYKDVVDIATELLAAEKERDNQIAAKAWDAALNRDMEEREYPYGKRTPFICPDKEEYLKSLTK